MVCEYFRHDNSRSTRAWKTKTTPIRELKRRKLVDMVPRLNSGLEVPWCCSSTVCVASSTGMTCANNLKNMVSTRTPGSATLDDIWWRYRDIGMGIMWTHFSSSRSCMLFDPVFSPGAPATCSAALSLLSISFAFWLKRQRRDCSFPGESFVDVEGVFSGSWEYSDEVSVEKRTTGMGESRLAKVLPEDSSIVAV